MLIKKKMAELAPAANPGAPVIPQLLAKDGELAAWMIGELRALGYTEVNLNLGCPSGTVTAKGKGSGMLRDPPCWTPFWMRYSPMRKACFGQDPAGRQQPGRVCRHSGHL